MKMMIPTTILRLALVGIIVGSLTACQNVQVYGSVGVGVGHSSGGFNSYSGGTRASVSMGGRIR